MGLIMGLARAFLALIPGWMKRAVVGGVGVVAIVWGFAEYNQLLGKKEVLADAKKTGIVNAQKSQAHHADARRPGAAGRLLKDSCRDC